MKVQRCGFSLVEVAMALGIATFAMITLVALLPIGLESNRISAEETKAAGILSALEADLKNTHPSLNQGKSLLYSLPLPYRFTSDESIAFNDALKTLTVDGYTVRVDEKERPAGENSRSRYQASVIYTRLPSANTLNAIQARLIVNWPSIDAGKPADLTDPGKVSGFVETVVSFPHP